MRLRTAVIGVGYLGKFHAQKHKALSAKLNSDLVAVCDLSSDRAQQIGSELGVQGVSDPRLLIGKVDAVTIATSTPTHYELAKMFLENKVHVNVEKPITLKSSQAEELVKMASQKSLVLSVGHSERFSPVFVEAQKKIANIAGAEFLRHAPYTARSADVSVVHDLMIHDIDLALSFDSSAAEVQAARGGRQLSKELDWAQAWIRFQSGISMFISSSRTVNVLSRTARLFSKSQSLNINFQTGDLEIATLTDKEPQLQKIETGKGDNLLLETENFLSAILEKKSPLVPGAAGLRALQVAEKVISQIEKTS